MEKTRKNLYIILILLLSIFIIIQYVSISNKISLLKTKNERIVQSYLLIEKNLNQILYYNLTTSSDSIINNITRSCIKSKVQFIINQHFCESCFFECINFLVKYTKDNDCNMLILADKSTYYTVNKMLQFNNKNIKVSFLTRPNTIKKGYSVLFSSRSGDCFLVPLPKNKEIEFLEKFIK